MMEEPMAWQRKESSGGRNQGGDLLDGLNWSDTASQ